MKINFYNLISFLGIFVLIFTAWLFSADKKRMNWRAIIWGIIIQIVFGLFIFVIPAGTKLFLLFNDVIVKILDAATSGSKFLFGRLAIPPGQVSDSGEPSLGFMLAFQGFPTIIFFSSFISILYFFRIMPVIIRGFAYIFTRLMKVSGAESLVTSSNIFAGVESVLTVKPYLEKMTSSEFCTILTAGMATVASNVLALYIFSLKQYFPSIAGHLISASILSAPAAIVMSKVIMPEKENPETLGVHVKLHYEKEKSFFEAVINGANSGLKMIAGIAALLVAGLGLISVLDLFISFVGGKINLLAGIHFDWTLRNILGYVFYPVTLIMGVPGSDAGIISKIIGERLVLTEVVSYQDLAAALSKNMILDMRSTVIATYALCGFAHIASMAIFVGGTAALAPQRTRAISGVAVRALIAATLACFQTACIAGMFYTNNSILLGN